MAPDLARAIVSRHPQDGRRQWKIEDVEVHAPDAGEVLVKIIASGVCHTDLGCGSFPDGVGFPVPPYPRVLGHEGEDSPCTRFNRERRHVDSGLRGGIRRQRWEEGHQSQAG
jgi:hypothetical protein